MKRILPIVAAALLITPAWAAEPATDPTAADVEAVLAQTAVAPAQPVVIGMSGWLQSTPNYTMHYIFSASAPFGNTPWGILTDYVPNLGTGHFSVSHHFHVGALDLYPALGYRFMGAASANYDGFLNGPQAQIGATYPILPWLAVSGSAAYSPYMLAMNKPGAGSYFDFSLNAIASYERVSLALGYTALLIDGANAGLGAFRGAFMGGPTFGFYTHF